MLLPSLLPLWSSRSWWLKLSPGCFLLPVSTSLRSQYVINTFQTATPIPRITPAFSAKVSLQNRLCHVWSSTPTVCQDQRACHRMHKKPQQDPDSWIQRDKPHFLFMFSLFSLSLLISLDKRWQHIGYNFCVFSCAITFCHVSKCYQF